LKKRAETAKFSVLNPDTLKTFGGSRYRSTLTPKPKRSFSLLSRDGSRFEGAFRLDFFKGSSRISDERVVRPDVVPRGSTFFNRPFTRRVFTAHFSSRSF